MKTSRITMKTGANSTGRSQRLRRGVRSVRSICGFNGSPLRNVRSVFGVSLAVREAVCKDLDPGTREGFILVSKAPPKARTDGDAADGVPRRAELADFLRTRREAVRPEDVGLPGGGRRRTPGLRREEVSQVAGVGTTWYTWLEQGRDVRASLDVLEALGRALRLTQAERTHLILLGRGEHAPPSRGAVE